MSFVNLFTAEAVFAPRGKTRTYHSDDVSPASPSRDPPDGETLIDLIAASPGR